MRSVKVLKIQVEANPIGVLEGIQTLVSHLSILLKKNTDSPGHIKTKLSRFEPRRQFLKQGDMWKIVFNDQVFYLKDQTGLFYIAYLLTNPNKSVTAIYLVDLRKEYRRSDFISSEKEDSNNEFADEYLKQNEDNEYATRKRRGIHHEQIVDYDAAANYYNRLTTIDEEIAEAKEEKNHAERARLINEKNELLSEVKIFHRKKKFKRPLERARQSVSRAIFLSLKSIEKQSEELRRHLNNSIKRGTYLGYFPEDTIPWVVSLCELPKKSF